MFSNRWERFLENVDITSEVSVDSQCPLESLAFHWKIHNYSKILNSVETEISSASKATTWRFRLAPRSNYRDLYLSKHFEGPFSKVEYRAAVKTPTKVLEYSESHIFGAKGEEICIFSLPKRFFYDDDSDTELKLENDVLNIHCTLKILGPTISRKIVSSGGVNSGSLKICSDLENLLLSSQHNDVFLSDGQKTIPAHKAILCARSPVFNIMFQQNMIESEKNIVVIEDIELETLQNFIFFLYTGKIKQLSWDMAMKLFYAADKYEVQDLRDLCSEFLQLNLTDDNVCSALVLGFTHNDNVLKEAVSYFIQIHSWVKLTDGWRDLVRFYPFIAEFYN